MASPQSLQYRSVVLDLLELGLLAGVKLPVELRGIELESSRKAVEPSLQPRVVVLVDP